MPDLLIGVAGAAVLAATPLLLAGVGELLAERSGVINVGLEGLILLGCIGGFAGAGLSGSPWLGLAAAAGAGAAGAALFAAATVAVRADQIVAGMALNLLALGASGTVWHALQDAGRDQLPAGAGFAAPYGMTVAALLIAVTAWWLLARTRAGLALRALGEAPDACAAMGWNVRRWRALAVVAGGALAGVAGAFLSIQRTHAFAPDMSGGSGFLVLALVIFGRWRIAGLAIGCLGFGLLDAVQQQLQAQGAAGAVSYRLLRAAPYLAALAALAVLKGGGSGPARLGRPWPER